MPAENNPTLKTGEHKLVITRVFDAPRELVWKSWTEPERLVKWWAPKNFTTPHFKVDLRVGGKFHGCMRSHEGKDFWITGTYKEIVPFERIVCTDSFSDEKGNVVPASHYGMPADFPLEMLITVTFEESGNKTKMTLVHTGVPAGNIGEMTACGWKEMFDKLAKSIEG